MLERFKFPTPSAAASIMERVNVILLCVKARMDRFCSGDIQINGMNAFSAELR